MELGVSLYFHWVDDGIRRSAGSALSSSYSPETLWRLAGDREYPGMVDCHRSGAVSHPATANRGGLWQDRHPIDPRVYLRRLVVVPVRDIAASPDGSCGRRSYSGLAEFVG